MDSETLPALRALADGTRLTLARLLSEGPFNVGEVQEILGLGQSTASHHLKILVDAGLLACRREGRLAWYEWSAPLSPPLTALHGFVREHAPALDEETRRRLHGVFEERADRTRRFFEGPGVEAVCGTQASERAGCLGADVVAPLVDQIPAGSVVADLGTGAGRLLPSLRTRGKRVIGIDASPNMLERAARLAREGGWTDVELRLGALEHLPLRDGEIDVAVAHQVLHHAAQPAVVLEEARRVLKPGGQLIVADFLPHDREWMREELADLWLGFDPAVLTRMLRAAGFLDVSLRRFEGRGDQLGMFVASARRSDIGDRKGDNIAKPRASRDPRRRAVKARSAIRGAIT